MFTTCLHCHAELGLNDQVEPFPVGRKLAFDSLQQRLWVVCTKCGRWNLSPLDERGEAIDACEKLYHDTVLRKSTGEVGLAKLPSGLELVRIGRPIFPEYADWRYGERFKRRRWINYGMTAVAAGGLIGVMWGLPAALSALGAGAVSTTWTVHLWSAWQQERQRRRVIGSYYPTLGAPARPLLGGHLQGMTIDAKDPVAWRLELPKLKQRFLSTSIERNYRRSFFGVTYGDLPSGVIVPAGTEQQLLTTSIHQINSNGAWASTVRAALQMYDEEKGNVFSRIGKFVHQRGDDARMKVSALPIEARLALEIQLAERRDTAWLEGELATLTAAWKEAEEIAAIADTLTGAEWIDAELEETRKGRLTGSTTREETT